MEPYSLCRICFESGHFCLNDYEVNVQGNNIPIGKMIQRFSEIEVEDGSTPRMICETCTHDLVQSYLFSEKVQEADARILKLLSSSDQEPSMKQASELQKSENEEETFTFDSPQSTEEQYTEEYDDLVENVAESQIVEEVYLDVECAEEHDELISFHENSPPQQKYAKNSQTIPTDDKFNFRSIYGNVAKETESKRKMFSKRRDRQNKEIYESGSFVITQFTPSAASKIQMDSNQSDEADETALSDIRTMNFETVEVEAKNMGVMHDADQGELPIDDSRVYLCQYCPKAFSSSAFLITHVRKSHGCKYCGHIFEKTNDLFKHIRELHATFRCVICEREFVNNSNLRNHLKTIHEIKVPANVALLSYKKDEKCEDFNET